jgi:hypothetical protein
LSAGQYFPPEVELRAGIYAFFNTQESKKINGGHLNRLDVKQQNGRPCRPPKKLWSNFGQTPRNIPCYQQAKQSGKKRLNTKKPLFKGAFC